LTVVNQLAVGGMKPGWGLAATTLDEMRVAAAMPIPIPRTAIRFLLFCLCISLAFLGPFSPDALVNPFD
jgi:hypothetical protein